MPAQNNQAGVERVKGIEPSYEAWEAAVLPLNYTRVVLIVNVAMSPNAPGQSSPDRTPARQTLYFRMSPRQRYFISRYSSMPWLDPSRPRPECLTPPNGTCSVAITPTLIPTMPYSSASATR